MKVKPVRPKDVKNFVQSFKKPQTWFKLFQQVYPLGSGGLRTGYTPPKHDFLSDISLPYDYREDYSQGGGSAQLTGFPEDVGLGGGLQESTAPRPRDKSREEQKKKEPWITFPDEFPFEPDLEFPPPEIPPEVPYYEPDEDPNVDEDLQIEDIPNPDEPRRPDPIIPITDECQPWLNALLGLPPCSTGASIQISTSKKDQLPKSKKNRKSRVRNNSRKTSFTHRRRYTGYYFSGF